MAHPDKFYHHMSRKKGMLVEKQKIQQDACAVSPVVGVMLMLVVTIIIAAVVSAFSGGFSEASRPAPSAIFDVQIQALEHVGANQSSGFNVPDMSISEISGDAIPTKDIRITTTYANNSGTTFGGNLSGEVAVSGNDNWYNPSGDWPSLTSTGYIGALI
ncbi:type IV pilin N-terminal domain-containing protein, partial [Methanoregula sp.]|uniref:type IV pilin N-terminal domain-containing protein n=1 Tax=Methanoregula sp. TaxID=2052170 RepID=UPI003C73F6FB